MYNQPMDCFGVLQVIFVERPLFAIGDLFADNETLALPYCHTCLASLVTNPWGSRVPHGDIRWPVFRTVQCEGHPHDAKDGQATYPVVYCSR